MKEKIKYFVAGIFIGLSELLPGISGATVALMFGVYEKILAFLSKFKNLTQLKEINLMIPLLLGMILGIFTFSWLIESLYENHAYSFNTFIAILMICYGIYDDLFGFGLQLQPNRSKTAVLLMLAWFCCCRGRKLNRHES